jgi:hypothetical protein
LSLRSPKKHENDDPVMPARMAGIQVRKTRPETSMSTWIPALHAGMTQSRILLDLIEILRSGFSKESVTRQSGPSFHNVVVRNEEF